MRFTIAIVTALTTAAMAAPEVIQERSSDLHKRQGLVSCNRHLIFYAKLIYSNRLAKRSLVKLINVVLDLVPLFRAAR